VLQFKNSALGIIASTSGALIVPPASVSPAQWAADNLIVPDGPRANAKMVGDADALRRRAA
jgi:hypothetical protein